MKAATAALVLLLVSACAADTDINQSSPTPQTYKSALDLAAALEDKGLGCKEPNTALKGFPIRENTDAATCRLLGDGTNRKVTLWVDTTGEDFELRGFVGVVGANWGIAMHPFLEEQSPAVIDALGGRAIPSASNQ